MNPEKTLQIAAESPHEIDGRTVFPISLGHSVVLETIGSPLATGKPTEHLAEWIETLFAMTRGADESMSILARGRETYSAAARKWACGTSIESTRNILEDVRKEAERLADVISGSSGDAKSGPTKAATATGPLSSPPQPKDSDGLPQPRATSRWRSFFSFCARGRRGM